jgi:hypothetical protein
MNGHIMENKQPYGALALGSVRTRNQAQRLVKLLQDAGFSPQDISAISPNDELAHEPKIALDHKPGGDPADEKPRGLADKLKSVIIGAISGGLILGVLGSLIGLASYAIPRFRFAISSPLAVALIYAAAGGATGVIAGALIGMRVPDHKAKQHAVDVRASHTIVSVRTRSPDALGQAKKILVGGGAEEVHEKIG